MGEKMIHQESWHKEASGLEKELARLRRALFDGQIGDLEYARAVVRMYPEDRQLLHRGENGRLFITPQWLAVHQDEVKIIRDLADQCYQILVRNSPTEHEAEYDVERGYFIMDMGEDAGGNHRFIQNMAERHDWYTMDDYIFNYNILSEVRDEGYEPGHLAVRPVSVADDPSRVSFLRAVDSEEDLNKSLPIMMEQLTKFLATLQEAAA